MPKRSVPATAAAVSLVLAPLLSLVGTAISPPLKSDAGAALYAVAAHPDRWYWSTILLLAGAVATVPAVLGIAALVRERSPRLGDLGGGLALLGALIALGDVMGQLTVWQMVAPGADHAQMTALLVRSDNAAGVGLVFMIGGLAILIGSFLLAAGLLRGHVVPTWAVVAFPAGVVVNLAGYTAASVAAVALSWALLLAAWLPPARALHPRRERLAAAPAVS